MNSPLRTLAVSLLLILGLAVMSSPSRAAPAEYVLDPDHLSIGFLVEHVGYAKVLGMFRQASGSYTFDEATGELSKLRVVIKTESVFTNHRKRDDHLRSADFLNSTEFPEMVFTADRARRSGERDFEIEGQLTLLGKTQPLTLRATRNKSDTYPFGDSALGGKPYVMGVSARGSFKRSAHGMSYSVANGWVGDTVELLIEFEARRQ